MIKTIRPEFLIQSSDELNFWIQKNIGIDTSGFPNLTELFSSNFELNQMQAPHIGLISSDNLKKGTVSHPDIVGIWLQGIDSQLPKSNGRVAQHSHGSEGIDEIIILDENSCYASLPEKIGKIGKYSIYYVPSGTVHGSNDKPSFGRWVSIKVKQKPLSRN